MSYSSRKDGSFHRNAWAQERQTGCAAPTRRAIYEFGLQAQHTEEGSDSPESP